MENSLFCIWLNEKGLSLKNFKNILSKLDLFLMHNKNHIAVASSCFLLDCLRRENKDFYIDNYTKSEIPKNIASGIEAYCTSLKEALIFHSVNAMVFKKDSFFSWEKGVFIPKMETAYNLYNKSDIDIFTGNIIDIPSKSIFSNKKITSSLLRVLNDYDGYRFIDFYECI